jgi:hypothetical protein
MTILESSTAGSVRLEPPVSWGAIVAGAFVAVAAALLLSLAGAGLGLALSFPGLASRASLAAFTPELGAYAMIVQVLAGALGGYVTGRLRTIWPLVHDDEAHFRDTAHGLITWALSTVAGVILAAQVLGPYADQLAGASAAAVAAADPQRAANIAAQSSLFIAVGMLLAAFVSAVAARIGGQRHEAMHLKARS